MNDLQRLTKQKSRWIAVIVAMIALVLACLFISAMQTRLSRQASAWLTRDQPIEQAVELK